MNIFEQINSIKLEDILRSVWIRYSVSGHTLNLFEHWQPTDWWKADTNLNIISDFSGKRAFWDRLSFIMKYNGLDKWEAVIRFKDTFNLQDEQKDPLTKRDLQTNLLTNKQHNMEIPLDVKKKVFDKWNSLPNLNDDQIEFCRGRWIDYTKVDTYIKNNQWYVSCSLYDVNWIISIQNRSITEKKFMIEKWTNSKWCFLTTMNKEVKKVYVVEWMFDFLSLAQFWVNVIGLKSANEWQDVVRAFYKKWYEIILIPDNDEAGKAILENLKDIKFSIFDLAPYEVKDINELIVSSWIWAEVLECIEQDRTKEPKNIDLAFAKFESIKSIFQARWQMWQKGPFELLDKETQWIIEWKVYTIGWFSNTWKSQFSYEYVNHFVKAGKKVWYFSIEVDTWLLLWYIAKAYYKKHFNSILKWEIKINRDDFKNLYLYDNISTLDWIIKTTEMEKFDIVFIDFIQWFTCPAVSSYEKMSTLAGEIQKMAIRNNCVVFSLSQVNNDSREKEWNKVMLKWSWDLFQSSDVIFILYEDSNEIKLSIAKNKFWKKWQEFFVKIDFSTWDIKLTKNSVQWFI